MSFPQIKAATAVGSYGAILRTTNKSHAAANNDTQAASNTPLRPTHKFVRARAP